MLDSSNLLFEDYLDARVKNRPGFTVGRSGVLKLAVEKETGAKYIVKHTYPHNAANEYVAMWLADKMRLPAPSAFLLSPCEQLNSNYAVAIEYIEGMKGFDKANVPEQLHNELIGHFILNWMISTDDSLQLGCANNHIYSYDFSEGFCVTNNSMLRSCMQGEDACVESLIRHMQEFKQHLSFIDFDIPELAREFHISPEKQKEVMISTAKRILDITEDEIAEMSDELDLMYPVGYDVYYEKCIEAMKEKMKGV